MSKKVKSSWYGQIPHTAAFPHGGHLNARVLQPQRAFRFALMAARKERPDALWGDSSVTVFSEVMGRAVMRGLHSVIASSITHEPNDAVLREQLRRCLDVYIVGVFGARDNFLTGYAIQLEPSRFVPPVSWRSDKHFQGRVCLSFGGWPAAPGAPKNFTMFIEFTNANSPIPACLDYEGTCKL